MKLNQIANNCTVVTDNDNDVYLFSYSTCIAVKHLSGRIELDEKYYKYSVTTNRHRCLFLGEKLKETEAKVANGTYLLTDLN